MTDYTKPFPCGECGKLVTNNENHTLKDCLKWKEYVSKNKNKVVK